MQFKKSMSKYGNGFVVDSILGHKEEDKLLNQNIACPVKVEEVSLNLDILSETQ